MTVTRDVVLDLLPLYFAGQVSDDTKKLVDQFLETDPDFARMSRRFDALVKQPQTEPKSPAAERRAFERTRMLLRYRNQTIGLAIASSLMPFSFAWKGAQVEWILLRDRPAVAISWALVAVACWVATYIIGRLAVRESASTP
jgi:hypothetical protein